MNQITVVTLGTGSHRLLTLQTVEVLQSAPALVLRTGRHPVAAYLEKQKISFHTLDALYEECEDFDTFNRAAAVHLLEKSKEQPLCYAVADPSMDATVMALQRLKPPAALVEVLPGVTHTDRCLARLGLQSASIRLYAAAEFRGARVSPQEALFLCEVYSQACAGDCKLKLMELLPAETPVTVFQGDEDGGLTQSVFPLYQLDRQVQYNHLTAVYIPPVPMADRSRFDMDDLRAIMQQLRAPDGCPWDKEQTHETLLAHLLEECYEFIGAVREEDSQHMYDELGDVLLQVVFHAEIGRQQGEFTLEDVTTAISQKMIERHTHIFGNAQADTADQVVDHWEAIKRKQRGITSTAQAMEDVSTSLSPLLRAWKVQHKAAKVGFDFAGPLEALPKVREEAEEVLECFTQGISPEMELGDLLFAVVNVCRLSAANPDVALFLATNKFISRFQRMECAIKNAGKCMKDLTLSEMDVYWNSEKQVE